MNHMNHTNQQIQQRLKRAVEDSTPHVLPQILHGIENPQGGTFDMTNSGLETNNMGLPQDTKHTKKFAAWTKWAAAAAALALVFGLYSTYVRYTPNYIIGFDVNPSIELKVNQNEKVLRATALNADGESVLDNMDLKNVDLSTAANALIGSMVKQGYISEVKNSILISVENADTKKGTQLQQRLSDQVNGILDSYAVHGAVLTQSITEDQRIRKLAKQHNISLGKTALIDLLVQQDATLEFADIAALSINDINLLIASRHTQLPEVVISKGNASSSAYIGEQKAKTIAFNHAGVTESALRSVKIKLDYDNGRMVYEVEFHKGNIEYEYEIDATSGHILEFDRDDDNHDHRASVSKSTSASSSPKSTSTPSSSKSSSASSGGTISYARAREIALSHAGVSANNIHDYEIELDRDDGRMIYEIEFEVGNTEYEYNIDAKTGKILDWEIDHSDQR